MIGATELKKEITFLLNGKPYKVVKYDHLKIGRGGATVRLRLRNLETGSLEEKTMSSANKVEEISTLKRSLQYLFQDGKSATFMDEKNFEQLEIPLSLIKEELPFIKEGESVDILFWGEKPLSIDISPKVTLTVRQTDPGVKGNSATNVYKTALLENGINVKVPLFIKNGDKIKVDTRTQEYVERA